MPTLFVPNYAKIDCYACMKEEDAIKRVDFELSIAFKFERLKEILKIWNHQTEDEKRKIQKKLSSNISEYIVYISIWRAFSTVCNRLFNYSFKTVYNFMFLNR